MRKTRQTLSWLVCLLLLISFNAQATLDLEVTQGVKAATPIVVLPFSQNPNTDSPSHVIHSDLASSGRFKVWQEQGQAKHKQDIKQIQWSYWQNKKQNNLVYGQIKSIGDDKIQVSYQLWNVYDKELLLEKSYQGSKHHLRRLGHRISDDIFHKLTGKQGIFSTYIAYEQVKRKSNAKNHFKLMIADFDGHNPKTVFESNEPIMSPAWSPDGKQLAYVSFETGRPGIYVQNIKTGKRKKVASFPGIDSAPAWAPDGNRLAMVFSKTGNPDLYVLNFETFQLKRVTDEWSIDTEPTWTPDGHKLLFTSNRGGSPQIYQIDLQSEKVKRLTYEGRYNTSPSLGPNGQKMALLHYADGTYNIAVQNLVTEQLTQLTHGHDVDSPSMAPNGEMIVYGTRHGNREVLGIVSVDGEVHLRLPAQEGDVEEPAWSPIVHN